MKLLKLYFIVLIATSSCKPTVNSELQTEGASTQPYNLENRLMSLNKTIENLKLANKDLEEKISSLPKRAAEKASATQMSSGGGCWHTTLGSDRKKHYNPGDTLGPYVCLNGAFTKR
jgi:uncharacterized protein YlxW (UPF0749 family)